MIRITQRVIVGAALAGAFSLGFATNAIADQPRMQSALSHLMQARAELVAASADKGGHRAAALRATDAAIAHTRRGIRFDRRH